MKRLIIVTLIAVLGLVAFVPAPAQAHFMYGANCHIEQVTAGGRVQVKMTNRTYQGAYVQCGLRTNYGQQRYVTRWMPPRWYRYAWIWIPGNWTSVRINHVHIYR
jgi:hypothetical protein